MFASLILYGWAIIPFVYVQSFMCKVASTAYVWVTVFNIFSGTYNVVAIDHFLFFIALCFRFVITLKCKIFESHMSRKMLSQHGVQQSCDFKLSPLRLILLTL